MVEMRIAYLLFHSNQLTTQVSSPHEGVIVDIKSTKRVGERQNVVVNTSGWQMMRFLSLVSSIHTEFSGFFLEVKEHSLGFARDMNSSWTSVFSATRKCVRIILLPYHIHSHCQLWPFFNAVNSKTFTAGLSNNLFPLPTLKQLSMYHQSKPSSWSSAWRGWVRKKLTNSPPSRRAAQHLLFAKFFIYSMFLLNSFLCFCISNWL